MVERDFLMRILQEFFEAIAKVVRRESPGSEPDTSLIQERLNDMYGKFFKASADYYYKLGKEDILEELKSENYSESDICAKVQMLSELLYQDALIKDYIPERCELLEKSLYLLEYLNCHSKTFSWDRNQRIADVKKMLMEFNAPN